MLMRSNQAGFYLTILQPLPALEASAFMDGVVIGLRKWEVLYAVSNMQC